MKKSLTIYISKNDNSWLRELRKYAKDNHWSVSLAIRELLKAIIQFNSPGIKLIKGYQKINIPEESVIEPKTETKKVDITQFEAQIESKLAETDNKQMAECIKEMTNSNGEVNCYFFNNAREKHSFCKQYCWTRKDIWGKRVRL